MKVNWREADHPCANCGREFPPDRLDRQMWCPDCRAIVVRRATRVARIGATGAAAALMIYIFSTVGTSPRFMMLYFIMIAAAYFFLYRMIQRVSFEIIRSRGVPAEFMKTDSEDG